VTSTRKALFTWAGHACVALGLAGVFVPLMPTTPFLLLAAACYVRGSERHYRWLLNHRLLGPFLRNYREKRAIPRRAKLAALALMWGSITLTAWRVDRPVVTAVLIAVAAGVSVFLLRVPTLRDS
jgi:hypothetical protein